MNENKEVTLLSLDTSSTKTGWAVFKNGIYKKSGVLDWSGSGKRQNMSTINTLVKLIGGVWAYCVQLNMDTPMNLPDDEYIIFYKEYTPSEWRKLVGITARKRDDCKTASIKRIKDVYNLDVDDNEADAINIGQAYINEWG